MIRLLLFLTAALPLLAEPTKPTKPIDPREFSEPIRVACVGDSITEGGRNGSDYPAQLQQCLGDNWQVRNFGVSGRTLLRKGDRPYWQESAFREAQAFAPDAVVILLGANDTKPHNWRHKDEFAGDYRDLVETFRKLPSEPAIHLCRLIPVVGEGNFGITEEVALEASAIVERLAAELGLELIDLHAPLADRPELIPDRVHPNGEGYAAMARTVATALSGSAEPGETLVRLHDLFGDHAVLPRGVPLPVWGRSATGDEVTVEFAGQSKTTQADDEGRWEVVLDPLEASAEPATLVARGNRRVEAEGILVGDVWLASGQSNMERQLGPRPPQPEIIGWREAAAAADLPLIREFNVPRAYSGEPLDQVDSRWVVATPESVVDFSAVGFFFARDLQPAIGVPLGIIHSSWGGTRAEAWTSAGALREQVPEFRETLDLLEGRSDPRAILNRWFERHDPGSGEPGWEAVDHADETWKNVQVPLKASEFGMSTDLGLFWFRRDFELPAGAAGEAGMVHLGQIDDEDTVWVNGREVGSKSRWQDPRDYPLPAGLLREGRNVIAVRILNPQGQGGWISEPSVLRLEAGGTTVPLAGEWKAKLGVDLRQQPLAGRASRPIDLPARLYNAMIAPLPPFPIKGVIWYQGESNNHDPAQYRRLLPTLIGDWRKQWQQPELPFLIVQIAPYQSMTPELREAQLQTVRSTPRTALAVTTDVGDARDIHPAAKAPVGQRLALAARAVAYGEDIPYSGPLFRSMEVTGAEAILHFDHVGGGLVAKGGPLTGFTVAGDDGEFHPASAGIRGDTVVVSSPRVSEPAAVRYGWANVPEVNLFNEAGLPASPFRSDAP